MKMLAFIAVASLGLLAFGQNKSNPVPQLGKDSIKKVIAAMTLEEKAYFVTGTGMNMPGIPGLQMINQRQALQSLAKPRSWFRALLAQHMRFHD